MGKGGGKKGGGKGGKGGGKGAAAVVVKPHLRFEGFYVSKKGNEQTLMSLNMVPGVSVYGEKRVSSGPEGAEEKDKKEYRFWSPFRSKLAASIVLGVNTCGVKPGAKVLYLGAASGTTVSHVSDVVGPTGWVYAVEFSHRSGRDLVEMAKKRPNVVPIVEDARYPLKYRMLVPMVDCIFMDIAQPDQTRILGLNAQYFLKNDGDFMISLKANCIDSTQEASVVITDEMNKMKALGLKRKEKLSLEPFERDHAVIVGTYRSVASKKE
eukprot:Rhum_TRINITY_DN14452_c11_g1::Rhum_TRINITY_DN14452_c11_g1_i1::g.92507::m.92507/K14563/NOP1, FBL; rRNA 2'-O-methyltransferase fibrillarin